MLLTGNFSSVPAHSYIPPETGATKADLSHSAGRFGGTGRASGIRSLGGQEGAQHRERLRAGFGTDADSGLSSTERVCLRSRANCDVGP